MKVYEALLKVKNEGPGYQTAGICFNVEILLQDTVEEVEWDVNKTDCFTEWSKFSGDSDFPVPHCSGKHPDAYGSIMNLWFPRPNSSEEDIKYIELRHELLDHCIEWFRERDL